jgi:Asp/Glu/hydantoin racemase
MVPWLKEKVAGNQMVTGIFEASVATALQIVNREQKFGIVSTGKVWEELLTEAVAAMLGTSAVIEPTKDVSARFAGVETTGLNATELHDAPPELVRQKMKDATKRLLRKGDIGAICLGCAGMSGMNEMVREAAVEELGEDQGQKIKIIDGVPAGAAWLDSALRLDC